MAEFTFVALALAPLVAPVVILTATAVLLVRWVRRRMRANGARRRRLPDVVTCGMAAVAAAAAAYGAYGVGVFSGGVWQQPDEFCALHGVAADRIVTRQTLPVSARCVTADGVGTELVPSWVNPVIDAGLAVLAVAILLGVLARVRR
ncbi:hypothetical protein [Streptacidiphilus anmyonensis]|uniref:hypothetical protein n=1 Tax=Streptacidiphilus anmyonensis TaxID=405782 RepID=UPI0005A7951A|nr:hypothetical protein [Streptacidiphilus anmyonensis]